MAWENDPLTTTTKIRKMHIDEIISRLNTERTERGYNTVSISITPDQTKIMNTHITNIRSWIDGTPLTVGCSTHYITVYSAKYGSVDSSHNSSRKAHNSRVCSHNNTVYNTKAPCFIILRRVTWRGLMLL